MWCLGGPLKAKTFRAKSWADFTQRRPTLMPDDLRKLLGSPRERGCELPEAAGSYVRLLAKRREEAAKEAARQGGEEAELLKKFQADLLQAKRSIHCAFRPDCPD